MGGRGGSGPRKEGNNVSPAIAGETPLQQRIRDIYAQLRDNPVVDHPGTHVGIGPTDHVFISDIRAHMPGVSVQEFNAALRSLSITSQKSGVYTFPAAKQAYLTKAHREGGLRMGDETDTTMRIERR